MKTQIRHLITAGAFAAGTAAATLGFGAGAACAEPTIPSPPPVPSVEAPDVASVPDAASIPGVPGAPSVPDVPTMPSADGPGAGGGY